MVGILTVLSAVGRLAVRDLRTFTAAGTNNFFLFCFLLLQQSGIFLQVVLALLLLFPLSVDPLRRVPKSRWLLWPFGTGARVAIRAGSFVLSPAAWIAAALFLWLARPALGLRFAALSLTIGISAMALSALSERLPSINPLRHIPPVPGRFGGLVRKDIREMLSLLDPYCGLILAICGLVYRILSKQAEPDAIMGVTLLIVLSVSTYANLLFGLDSDSGLTRYRLMPLRGWTILGAKGAAFLLVLIPMIAGLAPLAGISAALVGLAIGHHSSVTRRIPLYRWRFSGGGSIGESLVQVIGMFSAGVMTGRQTPLFLLACVAAYAISLAYYGRMLDRARAS